MAKVRGSGSIYQLDTSVSRAKCRKWQLRISLGRDLATGKYKRIGKTFNGSLTDAKKALRELVDELERDSIQPSSTIMFDDYCDIWIERRSHDVATGTWRKDADRLKGVRALLKDARMTEVTPEVLEGIYARLMAGESVSGRPLSGKYVGDIATTLHRLFRDAMRDGILASNPCDLAERPKSDTKERNAIRAESIIELLSKLDRADPSQMVIVIALKTGMRRGEIHGLSWGDVDTESMEIRVHHNFTDFGELKDPKTMNGYRDIPMPDSLADDLKVRRAFQEEQARAIDYEITDDTPIICNELFERELPHSSTRWWARNREALGFPNLTIHEMRHSFLSEMARRKVDPKVLQKLAGHAKYSTTMDIYTHVDMEDKREAMKAVDW